MQLTAHKGSKGQLTSVHLQKGDRIHFIGISGVAMAGVAGLLKSRGFQVQGSDANAYPPMSEQLKKTKIPLMEGYSAVRIQPPVKLVVVGNAISSSNEEAKALTSGKIPYVSLPEMIHHALIQDKQSLVVSGTHGKSTTSAMTAWMAEFSGKNPSFLIGGVPNNFNQSFKQTDSSYFVIEGDEYDTAFFDKRPKFIHYQPFSIILTSIEFDHVDIYENLEKVKSSFEMLLHSLPQDGFLIANGEDKNIQDIIHHASSKNVVTYGVTTGDYQLENRKPCDLNGMQSFSVKKPDGKKVQLSLPVFGLHNAMNALGAFALGSELNWEQEKIVKALSLFQGVKRRFQILKESNKALLIEDFAHHPTAVKAVLGALKERYPDYDIIAVFEPRSASSRRSVFQKHYVNAFSQAHRVFTAPPFREFEIQKDQRFSSQNLVQDLNVRGTSAFFYEDVKKMAEAIVQSLKKKSVIVVMSNGPFGGIHSLLKNLI